MSGEIDRAGSGERSGEAGCGTHDRGVEAPHGLERPVRLPTVGWSGVRFRPGMPRRRPRRRSRTTRDATTSRTAPGPPRHCRAAVDHLGSRRTRQQPTPSVPAPATGARSAGTGRRSGSCRRARVAAPWRSTRLRSPGSPPTSRAATTWRPAVAATACGGRRTPSGRRGLRRCRPLGWRRRASCRRRDVAGRRGSARRHDPCSADGRCPAVPEWGIRTAAPRPGAGRCSPAPGRRHRRLSGLPRM